MAGYIPEHIIDRVRDAVDIVQVISGYINLRQAGTVFRGLCPFHEEKTPSFTVNPARRIFHCFGCGAGGNVFKFIMLQKGVSFPEAVAELAERTGIDLPVGGSSVRNKSDKTALLEAVSLAGQYFEDELSAASGDAAREYLAGRGLSPDLIAEFKIGWAPPGWDNLRLYLEAKKIPPEVMSRAGLVKPRKEGRGFYDVFRGRVITPIFDLSGNPVAFGGRLLREEDNQPKYLNSPETPIYKKGRLLYGLDRHRRHIREQAMVLVVEGYFDLLSLAAHGIRNVVATLGTALTKDHLRLLKGQTEQVILLFDADEAGRSAAARALPLFLSADLEGRVLTLPQGHDPDTFVRAFGPEVLVEKLNRADNLLDFYLERTMARHPDSLTGKSRVVQEVLTVLQQVDDAPRRDLLRKALTERLRISEQALMLSERRSESKKSGEKFELKEVETDLEMSLLRLVLLHPEVGADIFSSGFIDRFQDQRARKIHEAMNHQFIYRKWIDVDRLLDELEEEEAALAAALASSDDGLQSADLKEVVLEYKKKFAARNNKYKTQELSRRIKMAQEAGDEAGILSLLAERNRLLKESST